MTAARFSPAFPALPSAAQPSGPPALLSLTLTLLLLLIAPMPVSAADDASASPALAEPGWVWNRSCWQAPEGTDSLSPLGGLGSLRRLRVFRNGAPLLLEQDYRIAPGDSVLRLAAPLRASEELCLERASTPLLANPAFTLYRREQVPVYHGGALDSAWESGTHFTQRGEDTAYSKYQLNYSGSKSMAVTVGSGGGLGLDASLFINLNGQVAEDVFVEGQLSDQNVPIQPEGNTATLKEVDTKYIRVFGSHYSYTLGN
ncbi:MAG: hypothetical protein ABI036_11025, partial [Fibrobacteria bacterium]